MARDKWTQRFLELAKHFSEWSKDPSTKVGTVIVRPDRTIVSVGYNGFPRGFDDDPALYASRDTKYPRIVHAEINAVITAREALNGYALYGWPFLPCAQCAVCLMQAGISTFVAPEPTQEQEERWDFATSRMLLLEGGAEIIEVPRE